MNYGVITPDLDIELDDVPLEEGIDYDSPSPEPGYFSDFFRSHSEISTRSLCSAMGSYMSIREKTKHLHDATRKSTPDYDVPLHKLRGLRGVYKSGLVTYSHDLNTRKMVNNLLMWESSVYKHRKESPQLRGGSRNAQHIQNKPLQRYFDSTYNRDQFLPSVHLTTTKSARSLRIPDIHVDISAPPTPRSVDGYPLLRRPALRSPTPVSKEKFEKFTSYIALKQKRFRTPTEQYSYYKVNFPLLLHSNLTDVLPDPKPKVEEPEITDDPDLLRKLELRSRISNLDTLVDKMEEETTDIDFRTELRDEVFDPTKYDWNKNVGKETPPNPPHVTPQSTISPGSSIGSSPRSLSP